MTVTLFYLTDLYMIDIECCARRNCFGESHSAAANDVKREVMFKMQFSYLYSLKVYKIFTIYKGKSYVSSIFFLVRARVLFCVRVGSLA